MLLTRPLHFLQTQRMFELERNMEVIYANDFILKFGN